eukprot:scaffold44988_cov67-Phaeocystis_antarctica.AAC.9
MTAVAATVAVAADLPLPIRFRLHKQERDAARTIALEYLEAASNSRCGCAVADILLVGIAGVAALVGRIGASIYDCSRLCGYCARVRNGVATAVRPFVELHFTNRPAIAHVAGGNAGSQAPPCTLPKPLSSREKADAQHVRKSHVAPGFGAHS